MSNQQSEFVGPGKVFETEEEEFAEYIEMMEWATQATRDELDKFRVALKNSLGRL
jgi:hypothetical protein